MIVIKKVFWRAKLRVLIQLRVTLLLLRLGREVHDDLVFLRLILSVEISQSNFRFAETCILSPIVSTCWIQSRLLCVFVKLTWSETSYSNRGLLYQSLFYLLLELFEEDHNHWNVILLVLLRIITQLRDCLLNYLLGCLLCLVLLENVLHDYLWQTFFAHLLPYSFCRNYKRYVLLS